MHGLFDARNRRRVQSLEWKLQSIRISLKADNVSDAKMSRLKFYKKLILSF